MREDAGGCYGWYGGGNEIRILSSVGILYVVARS